MSKAKALLLKWPSNSASALSLSKRCCVNGARPATWLLCLMADEAGINLALTRLYGRARRGERVIESVPRNYGEQPSLISSLSLNGVEATMSITGAVDTLVFNAYIERVLRPTIKTSDVIVLDNLAAHKASRIEQVAGECGATVIWLSPYSPDYSPIEMMWSKIKAYMRAARGRTLEELEEALAAALKLITEADCFAWFTHCGYQVSCNCKEL